MLTFILRRLAFLVPMLLVVTFVIFALILLLPGDPVFAILGDAATPAQIAELRQKLHLDQPIIVQYLVWLKSVLTGDFGRSLRTSELVSDMLLTRIPVTVELSLLSLVVSCAVGIPAGVIAAVRRNQWPDLVFSTASLAGIAMPYFWTGILLMMLFSVHLRWLPPSGYIPLFQDPLMSLKLMIMPALTVGLPLSAVIMRQTRNSMVQVLSQDYIRTAEARGVSPMGVLFLHALRNALIPVVTVIGLQIGSLIGGSVVAETMFSLPGLGRMVIEGIFQRDFAPVQAAMLIIVIGVLLANLLTDLSYAVLDKRVKI
ncbi:peptide/nickel transport system permease protein [Phyllobacterium trifolii]|uniref:Peptide/nickel transport system permease protein n=1 Tax=Phyllobacterium trifolii TaxID=300193 RepID=A0A839UD98_9HYPH|nr:ABC transporter permease [Phyllobacterium trifolii]MBB3146900.1 peptide/nickel transport system permease protein [Phyllobacterium trifolii]